MSFNRLKNIWTFVLIILPIVTIYWIQSQGEKNQKAFYENEINGVIDAIRYGDKKQMIVTIKTTEYNLLWFGIRKGEDVNIGDSLYKAENSEKLELHSKAATGGYIFTKSYRIK